MRERRKENSKEVVEVEVGGGRHSRLSSLSIFSNSPIDAPSAPPTPTPVTTRLRQRLSPAIASSGRKSERGRERERGKGDDSMLFLFFVEIVELDVTFFLRRWTFASQQRIHVVSLCFWFPKGVPRTAASTRIGFLLSFSTQRRCCIKKREGGRERERRESPICRRRPLSSKKKSNAAPQEPPEPSDQGTTLAVAVCG